MDVYQQSTSTSKKFCLTNIKEWKRKRRRRRRPNFCLDRVVYNTLFQKRKKKMVQLCGDEECDKMKEIGFLRFQSGIMKATWVHVNDMDGQLLNINSVLSQPDYYDISFIQESAIHERRLSRTLLHAPPPFLFLFIFPSSVRPLLHSISSRISLFLFEKLYYFFFSLIFYSNIYF